VKFAIDINRIPSTEGIWMWKIPFFHNNCSYFFLGKLSTSLVKIFLVQIPKACPKIRGTQKKPNYYIC